MPWSVSAAARIARVSVRTLHHYDEVGLLSPSERSASNHRRYTPGDLTRLHQILLFRELGFGLGDIRALMLDPAFDRVHALRTQREVLLERGRSNAAMLRSINVVLTAIERGGFLTEHEASHLFGGFAPAEHQDEARERWGQTEVFRQAAERTSRYTPQDWERLRAEQETLTARYLALMDAGTFADAPEALAVAGDHRALLERWFYDCPAELFAGLGYLWANDARFSQNIDRARVGFAADQSAAVQVWVAAYYQKFLHP